jgi:hypothetical protein
MKVYIYNPGREGESTGGGKPEPYPVLINFYRSGFTI